MIMKVATMVVSVEALEKVKALLTARTLVAAKSP